MKGWRFWCAACGETDTYMLLGPHTVRDALRNHRALFCPKNEDALLGFMVTPKRTRDALGEVGCF